MKYLIAFLLSSAAIAVVNPQNSEADKSPDPYRFYPDFALFYDDEAEVLYFVQYNDLPAVASCNSELRVAALNKNDLAIEDLDQAEVIRFSVSDEQVYGVGKVSGNKVSKLLAYDSKTSKVVFPEAASPGDLISCQCFEASVLPAAECASGGEGSTSCSLTLSRGLRKNQKYDCTLRCGEGYYACCGLENQPVQKTKK